MDVEKLRQRFGYIEELDRGRFAAALASLLTYADDPDAEAAELAPLLLDYIRVAPELLEMMSRWAAAQGDHQRLKQMIGMAESYFRLQEDELDEQRHGLIGLVDDAYLIGKLTEGFVAAGLPYDGMDSLAKANNFAAYLLGDEVVAKLHARILEAGTLPASDAVAAGAGRPEPQPDLRLLGVWHHKTFYESGDFSHMSVTSRLFGADGRYVEGDQSFVGMVFRRASGEESGRTDTSRASPSSRGSWALRDNVLILSADTGAEYAYKAEVYADSILLTQPGREAELWTRR